MGCVQFLCKITALLNPNNQLSFLHISCRESFFFAVRDGPPCEKLNCPGWRHPEVLIDPYAWNTPAYKLMCTLQHRSLKSRYKFCIISFFFFFFLNLTSYELGKYWITKNRLGYPRLLLNFEVAVLGVDAIGPTTKYTSSFCVSKFSI